MDQTTELQPQNHQVEQNSGISFGKLLFFNTLAVIVAIVLWGYFMTKISVISIQKQYPLVPPYTTEYNASRYKGEYEKRIGMERFSSGTGILISQFISFLLSLALTLTALRVIKNLKTQPQKSEGTSMRLLVLLTIPVFATAIVFIRFFLNYPFEGPFAYGSLFAPLSLFGISFYKIYSTSKKSTELVVSSQVSSGKASLDSIKQLQPQPQSQTQQIDQTPKKGSIILLSLPFFLFTLVSAWALVNNESLLISLPATILNLIVAIGLIRKKSWAVILGLIIIVLLSIVSVLAIIWAMTIAVIGIVAGIRDGWGWGMAHLIVFLMVGIPILIVARFTIPSLWKMWQSKTTDTASKKLIAQVGETKIQETVVVSSTVIPKEFKLNKLLSFFRFFYFGLSALVLLFTFQFSDIFNDGFGVSSPQRVIEVMLIGSTVAFCLTLIGYKIKNNPLHAMLLIKLLMFAYILYIFLIVPTIFQTEGYISEIFSIIFTFPLVIIMIFSHQKLKKEINRSKENSENSNPISNLNQPNSNPRFPTLDAQQIPQNSPPDNKNQG